MEAVVWWLIGLVAVAVGIAAFFYWRKQQYIKSLEALGWQWIETPDLGITVGLNVPPFGVGFGRRVDDQVIGRSRSGVPFQAFRYWSDSFRSDGYVLAMRLPKSLPGLYAFPASTPRAGVTGRVVTTAPLQVVTTDLDFGTAAWQGMAGPMSTQPHDSKGRPLPVDLGIDHTNLVMLHAPRDAQDLAGAVEWLAGVHAGLTSSGAMGWDGPVPPTYLSFQGRDSWEYVPRDDSMLGYVEHSGGGHSHEAVDIVKSDNFGLPFIRLTHNWQTTHTRTDSEGRTSTYTENHTEHLCQFRTAFPFREMSVNWGIFGGNRVQFESSAFNEAFKVRCPIPRFASDVFHPRQLEYFMKHRPMPFAITPDGSIRLGAGDWQPGQIAWVSDFLRGFFARVPDFTWKELGVWPRPIPEIENYNA